MRAEYKRDLQNNYLILEASKDADPDDYRFKMAEQNEIPGLLPFHSTRKDGVLYLHYEITSRQPLDSMYEKKTMKYDDIILLLKGIRDTLDSLQTFLLDPAQLVFYPEYLYIEPNQHRVQFCYLPGEENYSSITVLAEFILKHLDHRQQEVVVLGYGFYQKVSEENFSLGKTLREILNVKKTENTEESGEQFIYQNQEPGKRVIQTVTQPERFPDDKYASYEGRISEDTYTSYEKQIFGDTYTGNQPYERKQSEFEDNGGLSPEIRSSYGVTHRQRKRKSEKLTDRLFQFIHPAVLLSGLILIVLLEIVFYFGLLTITEAGGIFFLLISVETLINKFWKSSREKKKEDYWMTEDDDEMYQLLQEEMYQMQMPEKESAIEETRCLISPSEVNSMYLVCTNAGTAENIGEDICIGTEPVYVGKIKGESDVILDSPTVSRRHARLECRDGIYYVKDLNSRNGTFCNGTRLKPQEQCAFTQGDEIVFADVQYRAILRHFKQNK